MKFLSLDYEGSHRYPHLGCPVQIGLTVFEDENVIAQDEFIIRIPKHYKSGKYSCEVDAVALSISGFTLESIERDGIDPDQACVRMWEFADLHKIHTHPVVAFNTQYDLAMYRNMIYNGGWYDKSVYPGVFRLPKECIWGPWIDCMAVARAKIQLESYTLDKVAEYFGLARETKEHGAGFDSMIAGNVYCELRKI